MSDPQNEDAAGLDAFETLAFDHVARQPADRAPRQPGELASMGIVEFSQTAYLEAFPDVGETISDGQAGSALDHYSQVGRAKRWLTHPSYLRALAGGVGERPAHGSMSFNVDAALVSTNGTLFVVGWTDDRDVPLLSVSAIQEDEGWNTRALARCRRTDVEDLLQSPPGPNFGFWFAHKLGHYDRNATIMLRARFLDGRFTQTELKPRLVTDTDLRETVLGHFASLQYAGSRDIQASQQLECGAGDELVALNRSISHTITSAAHAERYGPARARFSASFVVCLFGKLEYFFLQSALFSADTGRQDVEFIYVSNSPELAEGLHKEALIAERIYGISITLVTLPHNAGFSAANNAAARFARSDRLVFINPDVFPRDRQWARTHSEIVERRPREETVVFGAPLYYDDGSLMHGGMYFEIDRGLSVTSAGVQTLGMIRVEHYGKGAPDWSTLYTRARPVPAVTGAFISTDRQWFETLGGFTEDYLFGHYEDADLCLKSLERGFPAWMHDVRFWHLEGKGSVRRAPHEGGSLVNRWLFSRKWGRVIEQSLIGRTPSHPLLNPGSADETVLVDSQPQPAAFAAQSPVLLPGTAGTRPLSQPVPSPADPPAFRAATSTVRRTDRVPDPPRVGSAGKAATKQGGKNAG